MNNRRNKHKSLVTLQKHGKLDHTKQGYSYLDTPKLRWRQLYKAQAPIVLKGLTVQINYDDNKPYYSATVPALPGLIATGDSMVEVLHETLEAAKAYLNRPNGITLPLVYV